MVNVKIGIAEDQAMFRQSLVNLINSREGYQVVLEVCDGKELINKTRGNVPDIIFVDFRMPEMNGIEATKLIISKNPKVKIVMLSNYDAEEFVIKAISSGAVGYLVKEDDVEEIFKAIDSVLSTGYYLNDRTSKFLIGNLVAQGKIIPKFINERVELTKQEMQVIRLMSKELTTREIADAMCRGVRTVDGYKTSIMDKIGAKNACGVVMFGVKNGIIDPHGN